MRKLHTAVVFTILAISNVNCHAQDLECIAGCDDTTVPMVTYGHLHVTGVWQAGSDGLLSTAVPGGNSATVTIDH